MSTRLGFAILTVRYRTLRTSQEKSTSLTVTSATIYTIVMRTFESFFQGEHVSVILKTGLVIGCGTKITAQKLTTVPTDETETLVCPLFLTLAFLLLLSRCCGALVVHGLAKYLFVLEC